MHFIFSSVKNVHSILQPVLTALLLLLLLETHGSEGAQEIPPPWVQHHWEILTREGGVWIADNLKYKNSREPYDAYGMKWEWGFAKKSVEGSLYAIRDGKKLGTFWTYRSFWHPGEKVLVIHQFGSDGTLGVGRIRSLGDTKVEQEMQFFGPDDATYQMGHREEVRGGARHSQSFVISDGEWQLKRTYIWKPSGG